MNKNCACDFVFGLDWGLSVLGCFLALVWVGKRKRKKKGNYFGNRNTQKRIKDQIKN